MRSCGIVTEYNPFHNGHLYQAKQAREKSQADVVVAVMSGNFLQRGEPAIIDKWTRAEHALRNGVDLVIELPFAHAVQAADYFTHGSIKLLQALNVGNLSFGTDYKEPFDYNKFAQFQLENKEKVDQYFQKIKNDGTSYPQQMTAVYRALYPEMRLDFTSPNHILAMGYARENSQYEQPMALHPIARKGSQHHQTTISTDSFASGTAIRQMIKKADWSAINGVVPNATKETIASRQSIDWEQLWPYLQYQLFVQTTDQLATIYLMTEGIEYRLKRYAGEATSFQEFVGKVKTKRFTWTRIQRLCLYILLQVKQPEIEKVWQNSYIRVLGFNECGREFLSSQKKQATLPVITNVAQPNEQLLELDIRAGKIYQMFTNSTSEMDYYRKPLYLK